MLSKFKPTQAAAVVAASAATTNDSTGPSSRCQIVVSSSSPPQAKSSSSSSDTASRSEISTTPTRTETSDNEHDEDDDEEDDEVRDLVIDTIVLPEAQVSSNQNSPSRMNDNEPNTNINNNDNNNNNNNDSTIKNKNNNNVTTINNSSIRQSQPGKKNEDELLNIVEVSRERRLSKESADSLTSFIRWSFGHRKPQIHRSVSDEDDEMIRVNDTSYRSKNLKKSRQHDDNEDANEIKRDGDQISWPNSRIGIAKQTANSNSLMKLENGKRLRYDVASTPINQFSTSAGSIRGSPPTLSSHQLGNVVERLHRERQVVNSTSSLVTSREQQDPFKIQQFLQQQQQQNSLKDEIRSSIGLDDNNQLALAAAIHKALMDAQNQQAETKSTASSTGSSSGSGSLNQQHILPLSGISNKTPGIPTSTFNQNQLIESIVSQRQQRRPYNTRAGLFNTSGQQAAAANHQLLANLQQAASARSLANGGSIFGNNIVNNNNNRTIQEQQRDAQAAAALSALANPSSAAIAAAAMHQQQQQQQQQHQQQQQQNHQHQIHQSFLNSLTARSLVNQHHHQHNPTSAAAMSISALQANSTNNNNNNNLNINNISNINNNNSINLTSSLTGQAMIDFKCDTCASSFDDRHRLMQHQSIHLELKKDWFTETPVEEVMKIFNRRRGEFLCNICNLRFEATLDYDQHNHQVHGPRPYCCQFCGNGTRTFKCWRQYLNHLYDHRYIFSCTIDNCDFTVNRRDSLRFHIFRFHLNCQLPQESGNGDHHHHHHHQHQHHFINQSQFDNSSQSTNINNNGNNGQNNFHNNSARAQNLILNSRSFSLGDLNNKWSRDITVDSMRDFEDEDRVLDDDRDIIDDDDTENEMNVAD